MSDVLVVGCGLLGTSVGLALQGSDWGDVTLTDVDAHREREAVRRGAGRAWDGKERAQLVVAAVPPSAVAATLTALQNLNIGVTYTHLSSVQSQVQREVDALSPAPSLVVGGHPLAGRELTGPEAAVADLFVGRPWAVCAVPGSSTAAVDAVHELALACAAVPVRVEPETHDRAVALLSHLPQIVSSALAGALVRPGAGGEEVDGLPVVLAGPGLVDTTRLAAGDIALWTDILTANAAHVAPLVAELAGVLMEVAEALSMQARTRPGGGQAAAAGEDPVGQGPAGDGSAGLRVVQRLLREGNRGRAAVPVKRGELSGAFEPVRVVLPDQPGRLAQLLQAAGEAGVNVEDVRVEHVPGRASGVIELLVATAETAHLVAALQAEGWHVA